MTALERCAQAQAAEAEPLPVTLSHDCGPECVPCDRCSHCEGDHGSGYLAEDCELSGCGCTRFLADGDCHTCDGHGVVPVPIETASGRVLDDERPCPDCTTTAWRWVR